MTGWEGLTVALETVSLKKYDSVLSPNFSFWVWFLTLFITLSNIQTKSLFGRKAHICFDRKPWNNSVVLGNCEIFYNFTVYLSTKDILLIYRTINSNSFVTNIVQLFKDNKRCNFENNYSALYALNFANDHRFLCNVINITRTKQIHKWRARWLFGGCLSSKYKSKLESNVGLWLINYL